MTPATSLTSVRGKAPRVEAASPADAGRALRRFGSALFAQCEVPDGGNFAISPYSVYVALALAAEGARGDTATQFEQLLGSAPAQVVTAIESRLTEALSSAARWSGPDPDVLRSANQVVVDSSIDLADSYLEATAAGYDLGVGRADFPHDCEQVRREINRWVGEVTAGLIPNLLPARAVHEGTLLVLVNALYLKARWEDKFVKERRDLPFRTPTGRVSAPMMRRESHLAVHDGDGFVAVRVPYQVGALVMTLVLPQPGRFEAIAADLDEVLEVALSAAEPQLVELVMPTFAVEAGAGLRDPLERLGLLDVFDAGRADLSGIAQVPGGLVVERVVHRAVVKVDETGTEAAAATAIATRATGMPTVDPTRPRLIKLDRPFFFVIHEVDTGAPLFIGRVVDPTRGGAD